MLLEIVLHVLIFHKQTLVTLHFVALLLKLNIVYDLLDETVMYYLNL